MVGCWAGLVETGLGRESCELHAPAPVSLTDAVQMEEESIAGAQCGGVIRW